MRQTEMVALMQLENVPLTREALVKIERGIQHIQASQLRAIRNVLGTTYDELLKLKRQIGVICHFTIIFYNDSNSFIAAINEFEEETISFSVHSLQSGICESILISY